MNITLNVSPELEGQLQQAARMQETDVTTYLLESARLRGLSLAEITRDLEIPLD